MATRLAMFQEVQSRKILDRSLHLLPESRPEIRIVLDRQVHLVIRRGLAARFSWNLQGIDFQRLAEEENAMQFPVILFRHVLISVSVEIHGRERLGMLRGAPAGTMRARSMERSGCVLGLLTGIRDRRGPVTVGSR